jgi:hypothetical protein
MAQAAKAQEPSMEEILASIRRIISDDETKPPAEAADPPQPPGQTAQAAPAVPRDSSSPPKQVPTPVSSEIDSLIAAAEQKPAAADVLQLTEAMAASEPTRNPPAFRTIDGRPDVVFADAPAVPIREGGRGGERLLSNAASAAVDSAFSSLAEKVLVQDSRSIEDLVREMLRPMLKTWLDDNLPSLVERLVRAEIERVSRGHG